MSYVQHNLSPDQIAVKIARAIQYEINGLNLDIRDGEQFPSKALSVRDRQSREAGINRATLMLSIALYGDDVHLPEAEAFVKSAPWKEGTR